MRFGKKKQATPTDVRTAYALWAPSYPPTTHNPLMEAEQSALISLLPDVTGHLSLDVACGSGRYLQQLAERGAHAIGLDLSPEMLRVAPADCDSALVTGDMKWLPFADATFDSMVCSLAVGHLQALGRFTSEAARILKPGGHLLYSDFHPFLTLHGLQRTFRDAAGVLRSVDHHLHLYADHQQALNTAGLELDGVAEPMGTTRDRRLPESSPLALVLRARKP